ncbi:hypothetical protein [Pedococcus sp. 5OH_020]|uniref:hypothetical protein n=1 Tax=Pedococcus sp. 5OH_020 TaxID=2989814 RepID=UPI0022E9E544|nr:hypothetical protein [Pedococcus sp. 5OH_020]
MSEIETRLRDLLHDTAPDSVQASALVEGARRYAIRARRVRVAAVAAAVVAAVGVGGAVASGALHDRTLSPATPKPTTSTTRTLPPGPAWVDSTTITTGHGTTFTFDVRAVITAPATSAPDPLDATKRVLTAPQMGGYYTLTNTSGSPYDLGESVRLYAYWKVPTAFCDRIDAVIHNDLVGNHTPVPQLAGGQTLCPIAWGDSTLDTTPQTLRPHTPASITILPTNLGFGRGLHLSRADAALAVRVTATPPAGWIALTEPLSTSPDHRIASKGLPAP